MCNEKCGEGRSCYLVIFVREQKENEMKKKWKGEREIARWIICIAIQV